MTFQSCTICRKSMLAIDSFFKMCYNYFVCNTSNPLPVVALQSLLSALQTTVLFAIEDSI
ncbi:MAG: hypothetical protein PUG85_06995 [Oscillospiraceae bacterium]|nr:hypothetical protein [Oscillospiraceae bacterium]